MAIEMMSISHCYCSEYMTKPTQFGDEPQFINPYLEIYYTKLIEMNPNKKSASVKIRSFCLYKCNKYNNYSNAIRIEPLLLWLLTRTAASSFLKPKFIARSEPP